MFQSSRFEVFPRVFFAYVEYLDGYEDRQNANITYDLHYLIYDFLLGSAVIVFKIRKAIEARLYILTISKNIVIQVRKNVIKS